MFYLESCLSQEGPLKEGYVIAQAAGGPKFRGLGEGEDLNQSLINKHLFRLISGDKAV